jgi:hypothetical protein
VYAYRDRGDRQRQASESAAAHLGESRRCHRQRTR